MAAEAAAARKTSSVKHFGQYTESIYYVASFECSTRIDFSVPKVNKKLIFLNAFEMYLNRQNWKKAKLNRATAIKIALSILVVFLFEDM